MAVEPVRAGAGWLALREPADAEARSAALVDDLLGQLPSDVVTVVHDLGSGTGSMLRWLAPRLPPPQRWVLHDRDPYLLHFAAVASPRSAADGSHVTVETRRGDIAQTGDGIVDQVADRRRVVVEHRSRSVARSAAGTARIAAPVPRCGAIGLGSVRRVRTVPTHAAGDRIAAARPARGAPGPAAAAA